jgi:predicted AAA+ superfamily ATPase
MAMVPRPEALKRISRAFRVHPIAALLGPRQCGKTTLARVLAEREPYIPILTWKTLSISGASPDP